MHDLKTSARLLACALALTVAACSKHEPPPKPKPTLTVTSAQVTLVDLPRKVDASGTVAAWQEVPVASEAGGLNAVAVLVDEGSYVQQGQLLVKLNDSLLLAELRRLDAQVASAKALQAQADAALKRAQELRAKGFLAQATLESRLAEQRTAAAGVQSAEAARGETKVRLEQTNIRAPVSGLITARSVVKGQTVSIGTELLRLVRQGQIELNAQVPESDLRLLRAGMSAQVTSDQTGSATGVIRLVTPQVDPQTRLGLARITVPTNSGLRPGNFARASIEVGAQPALTAPLMAVVYREGKPGLYVIDPSKRVRFVQVVTGARVADRVELVSGVTQGATIAVQGAGFLGDGDLVEVSAAAPAKPAVRTAS
jgi:RND family efflux transporter MFP subunit